MRKKIVAQPSLFDQAIRTLLVLFKPEKTLKRMDDVLEEKLAILEAVHRDLTQGHKVYLSQKLHYGYFERGNRATWMTNFKYLT